MLFRSVTTGREKKAKRRSRRTRSAGRVREEALPELGDTALPELEAGDYVEESGRGARARSTRGEAEAAPAVSIGGVGSKIALDTQTRLTKLPNETDLSVPPPDTDVLDAAMIQRVVRSKQASVRLCYEKSLKARENISGKLAVALVVEPSGRVTNADIVSPAFRGSVVGDCIVRSIKGWRFPRFQGGAQEIELPFVFQKGV